MAAGSLGIEMTQPRTRGAVPPGAVLHLNGSRPRCPRRFPKPGGSKLFKELSRAITVAVREGGIDPAMNISLAKAIKKAKSESLPKDNIERALPRGGGGAEGEQLESILYEGYGPTRRPRATENAAGALVMRCVGGMGQRPGNPPAGRSPSPRRGWPWPPPRACHPRHSIHRVAIPDHAIEESSKERAR